MNKKVSYTALCDYKDLKAGIKGHKGSGKKGKAEDEGQQYL